LHALKKFTRQARDNPILVIAIRFTSDRASIGIRAAKSSMFTENIEKNI
jgi:hypothetical protein